MFKPRLSKSSLFEMKMLVEFIRRRISVQNNYSHIYIPLLKIISDIPVVTQGKDGQSKTRTRKTIVANLYFLQWS